MVRRPAVLNAMERWLRNVAAACLMGMALVTGADIVCRWFWNSPILGSEEIVAFLAALTLGFSLPYAHSQGSNIGVELFYSRLSRRVRRRIKLCTDVLGAALFGLVAWRMFLYGANIARSGEVSMTLELPKHYIVHALGVGFTAFALVLAWDVVAFFLEKKSQ